MKDYEVNYVHQDSKTSPDSNHIFETATKPAPDKCSDFIEAQNLKTCEGCMHLPWKYEGSLMCDICSRGTFLADRYEKEGKGK